MRRRGHPEQARHCLESRGQLLRYVISRATTSFAHVEIIVLFSIRMPSTKRYPKTPLTLCTHCVEFVLLLGRNSKTYCSVLRCVWCQTRPVIPHPRRLSDFGHRWQDSPGDKQSPELDVSKSQVRRHFSGPF